ncbi:class I SAM-dependent methyltransferase [Pectobacterium brasiliense]|uniref:class I SAM-dependent methyltransferase n=1 Tax=Pectobacterium brasiliense TaxID=180957 RepID=UPI001968CCEB|nr:class I SAM-dependent methyltransferase [Pectobacterium brasiliense]MBN3146352.1 class I SAM-dependent methyltransferase [Pectobacterium brasiliense]QSD24268.1 class I SAM-dependent methyltransferase [Pectobacterium brasiliense]
MALNFLVFPSNMPESKVFSNFASSIGGNIVHASSENKIDSNTQYLPYITDESFPSEFEDMLRNNNINYVYSPHHVVWHYLNKLKETISYDYSVCDLPPLDSVFNNVKEACLWAKETKEEISKNNQCNSILTLKENEYANLYIKYNDIPGQSDNVKLRALCSIFTDTPKGDVVEIGSFLGRSGFALSWLAQQYEIGNVICVDPWEGELSGDQGNDDKVLLVNESRDQVNWDSVFSGFLAYNSGQKNLTYIRAVSEAAVSEYSASTKRGEICNNDFGCIKIDGNISLLHIDGNHKYEEAKKDVDNWFPLVKSGGWVLIDDYDWAFGEGPKKVGDELINNHRVAHHFIEGDTLYIKIR